MSRFRAWWRTSLCRVLGHRWHRWLSGSLMFSRDGRDYRSCERCGHTLVVRSSTSPTPPSSSSRVYRRVTPEDTNESIAAWRLAWAQASDARTSPSLLDQDTESASAPHGAGR